MSSIWNKILIGVGGFFVKKPSKKLTWCQEDYSLGKLWAKTQPHPFLKNKTLWDFVYDRYESVYTIDNINKYLFGEF
jgi:hypothetical protein